MFKISSFFEELKTTKNKITSITLLTQYLLLLFESEVFLNICTNV